VNTAETQLIDLRTELLGWLMDDALPLWWTVGADHDAGGFHEAIDLTGRPVLSERRARVQARQIFSYAVGGALGWQGPWRQAMRHGLDYFIARYRRPDGLFWNALTAAGEPVETAPHLYEQAFALLACATALGAGEDGFPLETVARAVLERLSNDRRGAAGGFTGFVDQDVYQTDPHMHLLEAALAWEQVTPDPRWTGLADEVAALCLARFMTPDRGVLLEYFDRAWTPAPGLAGRLVWPGHQFEWAGLLERWGLARGREDARTVARRLYGIGSKHGIDASRGVAIFELLDDFTVQDAKARLWSQTEWLKAALILARSETRDDQRRGYLADAVAAAKAIRLYLDTPVRGLWRDRLLGDGTWVDEPAPASSFYHIIDALRALAAYPG
jgi:mannose/cellobiose epimerase-like protein (N-acyl-D-glucosamine 2-epimerase family)